jgi:large subunit ribosomal protein L25
MSETIEVVAEARADGGKGASRRLRRQGLVPGIVYGGHQGPPDDRGLHNDLLRSWRTRPSIPACST